MTTLKSLLAAAAGLSLLALAGCSSPAGNAGTPAKTAVPIVKFGDLASVPAGFTLTPEANNANATYAALALVTDQAAQTNQTIWDYGLNTKAWVSEGAPARVPEAKALKFTIKAVGPATEAGKIDGQNAHTVLDLKGLTFPSLTDRERVSFSIKMDNPGDTFRKCGLTVTLKGSGEEFYATLNDAPNTNWDWLYWGDWQFINFRVPLSLLKPVAGNPHATFAAAAAAGVVLNEVVLNFRMDTGTGAPGEGGAVNTVYTGYLDNLNLY